MKKVRKSGTIVLFGVTAFVVLLQLQVIHVHDDVSKQAASLVRLEDFVIGNVPSREEGSESEMEVKETRDSKGFYETDELCGGCRWILTRNTFCGQVIAERALKDNMTLVAAAQDEIENRYQGICKSCLGCQERHKLYWRPDKAAPKVLKATTHYLPSVPDEHRVPKAILAADDDEDETVLKQYFSKPENRHPKKVYLFEYNPSIVKLPSSYQNLRVNGEAPAYVASYRLAVQHSCFATDTMLEMVGGDWNQKPRSRSYLAIALLRHDLSIIADAVVELKKSYGKREDFRLFVLHDELYLTSYCTITPLYIGTEEEPPTQPGAELIPNKFPSVLRLSMPTEEMVCSSTGEMQKLGKNLNYFVDANNQTQVEVNPLGTVQSRPQGHMVQPVSLEEPPPPKDDVHYQKYGSDDMIISKATPERPSFYTLDELVLAREFQVFESPYTSDRGSACCVNIEHKNDNNDNNNNSTSQSLMLGVSHVKVPYGRSKLDNVNVDPNQYLSRFYAFEPVPPYKTVALSGYFCFSANQPTEDAILDKNPLAQRKHLKFFRMGSMELDCPAIHFITGMTEKADDPSKLIIAYGVGDCTSWFVEVDKQQVVDLLWGPPQLN